MSAVDSTGTPFTERTNVANSVHKGVETYLEIQPLSLLGLPARWGTFRIFDALGYTHARYTSGEFAGHDVEFAPQVVNRLGLSYAKGRASTSWQWSIVSRQFTDANNTIASDDADVGVVPE